MAAVAIETSTRPASLAVAARGRAQAVRLSGERAHASDLLPELARLCALLGAEPAAIDTVFVGIGPGSYTGLRVGIATALGLARASGAALLGVPSGETIAYRELAPGGEGVLLLDARQGELYFARYRRTQGDVEVLEAPAIVRPSELAERLPSAGPIFGDDTVAEAAGLGAAERARLRSDVRPDAAALLELGRVQLARRGPDPARALEPLYLRPFAARERRR
jgi:tRNA threonylcarbamoyladenosine biosynthesis protein TsaB